MADPRQRVNTTVRSYSIETQTLESFEELIPKQKRSEAITRLVKRYVKERTKKR